MRASLLVLFVLLALTSCVSAALLTENQYQSEFSTFVKKFEKRYSHEHFFNKYNVFKSNLDYIHQHNQKTDKTYTLAVNEFADMSLEDFHAKMTGYKHRDMSYLRARNTASPSASALLSAVQAPASIDWRAQGKVTPVKNQGQCGSCWAFSTTGSVEGAHSIAKGTLVSLSEQQLMDCSTSFGNQGCNGGLMDDAFQYIIKNGVCAETDYPYKAADGTCKKCTSVATLSSYIDIKEGDEASMLAAVAKGPVSIAIEADTTAFQFYSGGVFNDASCGTNLDHGVLIVGYGSTSTSPSQDYWIVKNSWGASWGEGGYIRLIRGKNMCGLSNAASYPVV